MSELPKPRPRTMASDISKLFRSVASAPSRAEQDTVAPTSTQISSPSDKAGPTKKKITRIPLFGRTRKKSTHSSSSSPYASTSIIRGSTDVGEMSSRPPSSDPGRRPSLPSLSAPAPSSSKISTSSFTSKLAAHFSSSQSKTDLSLDSRASSSRTSLLSSPSSSGLAPPRTRPSTESGSSTSRNRSTTPRGARPVIMVSTTDNMDEFKDLFTKEIPTSKAASKPSGNSQDSDATQDFGPGSTSQSLETIYRRGQTPASVLAATVRDQQVHERRPSASSRNSRHTTDSEKSGSNEKVEGRTTPRPSSARESPRLVHLPEHEQSVRRPSTSQSLEGSSSVRSRMRPPSTVTRTKPPSIPLPDIPTTDGLSTKPDGMDLSDLAARAAESGRSVRRPRSNTISSIPERSPAPSTPSVLQDRTGSTLDLLNVANIDIDINTASPEHLRRALRSRNKQFEELTAYMLGREEAWSAERKALEKKITGLQRDLVRRDSEITGLKLIINDDDLLRRPKQPTTGILNYSRLSPVSTSPVQSDQEGSNQSHMTSSRRLNYHSDSGAESARGSGNESSSSILRLKRMHHRSSAIGGEGYPSRTGSTMRLPKFVQGLQEKTLSSSSESPYSKRVSIMSIASSASSSGASSLMPPSPSVTMSSLSAIPEGTSQETGGKNDLEDRRALRASRRISSSSMTSSSTAASSAYSTTNIKRSRPPSIAQVLEKSPNIEDVLEKLRPFA